MCFGCVYCARPHLQIFFSWMRQGGSWADKFHVKDGQVWLYKHKTYGSPWKFEVQMIFHVNNTWTIQLHTKTSIAHLSLQDYISMLLIQAIHIFIYIYIYTYQLCAFIVRPQQLWHQTCKCQWDHSVSLLIQVRLFFKGSETARGDRDV